MGKKVINVGLLGLGNVGGGVAQILEEHAEAIEERLGAALNLKKILVRQIGKPRTAAVDPAKLTGDPW